MQDKEQKMKDKHLEKLKADKQSKEQKANLICGLEFLFALGYALAGEHYNLPYTRLVSLVLLLIVYRFYEKQQAFARHDLSYYIAEQRFRKAAHDNDVGQMKRILLALGKERVNAYGPTTLKNALHFAVAASSIDAINFLRAVDKNLAGRLGHNVANIFNHQDSKGNTPVHDALLKARKTNNLSVLMALLINGNPQSGYSFFNNQPIEVNTRIDPRIKNDEGKTIVYLLSEMPSTNDINFALAVKSIQQLNEFYATNPKEQVRTNL